MILFSIITIIKNDPNGIKRTKKSISEQSFSNYEWIIKGQSDDENYLSKYKSKALKTKLLLKRIKVFIKR